MVKLEEVPDEEFVRDQAGPLEGEDDWDTDSGIPSPPPNHMSPNSRSSSKHFSRNTS